MRADAETFLEILRLPTALRKDRQENRERRALAPSTVRSHKNLIVNSLNQAIIDGILTANPAQHITVRGKRNKDYRKKEAFLRITVANGYLAFIGKNLSKIPSDRLSGHLLRFPAFRNAWAQMGFRGF